jgi:hypothetical protein
VALPVAQMQLHEPVRHSDWGMLSALAFSALPLYVV